jgi:adenylate cyclase
VDEQRRLLIEDASVSRNHLEIRIDRDQGVAYAIDTSTNGTRLNGVRIERGVPVVLERGDVLTVGVVRLEFRSALVRANAEGNPRETTGLVTNAELVMVVGDIVGFSTSSRVTPSAVVIATLETLLRELRTLLRAYGGTLSNFVGDAFLAIWELTDARTPKLALDFVMAAAQQVADVAPTLPMRAADGGPLRMGWGVAHGDASVSSMMGVLLGVVGDATNLAFRLSGVAGREGRCDVLVADPLYTKVAPDYAFEAVEYVPLKGWAAPEPVHGLRLPHTPLS